MWHERGKQCSHLLQMCESCKQCGHVPTKWHMVTGHGQSIKWFTVNHLKPELTNWALVSAWGSSTFEQDPTLKNVSENIWIRIFLYVCPSKQLIDNIIALCVGLLLARINWGFAVCLSVDNMRPNLDILLTTVLFAGFRPLGVFNLLDHLVHIQKTFRSWDLQPGHWQEKHLLPNKQRSHSVCHYNISIILSYMGEEVILFTHKEVIPSYRTVKSELLTKFTPKLQIHHTIESYMFLIKNSM